MVGLVPLLLGTASQPAIRPHPAVPFVAKSDRTALLFCAIVNRWQELSALAGAPLAQAAVRSA
mgnify:CR=1 FL=1